MRIVKHAAFMLLLLLSVNILFGEYNTLYKNYSNEGYLSSKSCRYYECYLSADKMAVFTLKNASYESDFDIYIYSDSGMSNLIGKGTNGGTTAELELVSQYDYGRTVYVKIVNDGSSYASYKLYTHQIDFVKILTDSLIESAAIGILEWMFSDDNDSEEDSRNKGRAATAIVSAIGGKNLGEIGEELLINEITTSIQEELGYGFWGNYAVNCATNFIREIYKYN